MDDQILDNLRHKITTASPSKDKVEGLRQMLDAMEHFPALQDLVDQRLREHDHSVRYAALDVLVKASKLGLFTDKDHLAKRTLEYFLSELGNRGCTVSCCRQDAFIGDALENTEYLLSILQELEVDYEPALASHLQNQLWHSTQSIFQEIEAYLFVSRKDNFPAQAKLEAKLRQVLKILDETK